MNSFSIPEHYVTDESVILYLYNEAYDTSDVSYQIGMTPCEVTSVMPIESTDSMIHTVILWDNSVSVMKNNDIQVRYLLQEIVANRQPNEIFTLATLSQNVDFKVSDSNDYVNLKQIIEQTPIENKNAYVVENLYKVINAVNEIKDYDFYRVVVISDGVDSSIEGVSLKELLAQLKETPCPIYTVSVGAASADATKNFFSISRTVNCGYFLLDESNESHIDALLTQLSSDSKVLRIETTIPLELRDGSNKNSQLTIGDDKYECLIKLPFSIEKQQVVEETVVETPKIETVVEEQLVENSHSAVTYALGGLVITGIVVLLTISIAVLLKKKKEKKNTDSDKFDEFYDKEENDEYTLLTNDQETVFIKNSDEEDFERTVFISEDVPMLVLENADKSDDTYSAVLSGNVSIGRGEKNRICLKNNKAVSEKHCEVFVVDGMIYIRDLGSSNGTRYKGQKIMSPVQIESGDKVSIGYCDYVISIK